MKEATNSNVSLPSSEGVSYGMSLKLSNPNFPVAKYSLIATVYVFSKSSSTPYTKTSFTLFPGAWLISYVKVQPLMQRSLPSSKGKCDTIFSKADFNAFPVTDFKTIMSGRAKISAKNFSLSSPAGIKVFIRSAPVVIMAMSQVGFSNRIMSAIKLAVFVSSNLVCSYLHSKSTSEKPTTFSIFFVKSNAYLSTYSTIAGSGSNLSVIRTFPLHKSVYFFSE